MRFKKLVLILATLTMVVGLAACGSSGNQSSGNQSSGNQGKTDKQQTSKETSKKDKTQGSAPKQGKEKNVGAKEKTIAKAPADNTLSLSIPKLGKQIDSIPTGRGDDAQLLTNNAAVHLLYTGFPWEKVANVYIAGHVEGYQGTPSYKAFAGLKTLENGDDLVVTDANGQQYTYKVYEKRVVQPTELNVLNPVPGKNIITLQTCEIVNQTPNGAPDYSNTERLIVRGELKDTQV